MRHVGTADTVAHTFDRCRVMVGFSYAERKAQGGLYMLIEFAACRLHAKDLAYASDKTLLRKFSSARCRLRQRHGEAPLAGDTSAAQIICLKLLGGESCLRRHFVKCRSSRRFYAAVEKGLRASPYSGKASCQPSIAPD